MSNVVRTVPHALQHAAAAFGEELAVADGEARISFAELRRLALQAAVGFLRLGVAPRDRIAIWAPNRFEWISACLGAQAAGAVIVPLNTRQKGSEAQYILNKTRAKLLVTVGAFLGVDYRAQLKGLELPHLLHVLDLDEGWNGFGAEATADETALCEARLDALRPEDPSDILFTSGTTGHPKGVVTTHLQSVEISRVWGDCTGLRRGDRYLVVNPFFHTFGYKAGWLACLLKGAAVYPMASLDVARLTALVEREKITVLPGPPTIFESLLASDETHRAQLSSLRLAVTGAASVAPALIARMRGELGIANVLTGYGLTESSGVVTMTEAGDSPERVATTCGRPIPGVEVRCVDPAGSSVAIGCEGEVLVRGFNVMHGYFEDADATEEAVDADGWLHTGDIGRFDADGYLQITDRLKDMYICGGFNCYPAEIERLMAAHPGVAQVAIIGVPDARLGEVGCAFVVPRPGAQLAADALVAWCRDAMANYKVPRQIHVVERLPTNASGKVMKLELRTRANA